MTYKCHLGGEGVMQLTAANGFGLPSSCTLRALPPFLSFLLLLAPFSSLFSLWPGWLWGYMGSGGGPVLLADISDIDELTQVARVGLSARAGLISRSCNPAARNQRLTIEILKI